MSACEVVHENIYDTNGCPRDGGINDLHMGTNDHQYSCKTCNGTKADCPGHFGHMKLNVPVYHIGFLNEVRRVLRSVCFKCSRLLLDHSSKEFESAARIRNPK